MIKKSKEAKDHAIDLQETFLTLRTNVMLLNPEKCVFGVIGGKCLGFLVDERGIEANPEKIQAMLNMQSPKSIKEFQKLTGCIPSNRAQKQKKPSKNSRCIWPISLN